MDFCFQWDLVSLTHPCRYATRHFGLQRYASLLPSVGTLVESFAVSLTNKVVGSDVIINQNSIDWYEGLGSDISTFNEDGLGFVYYSNRCTQQQQHNDTGQPWSAHQSKSAIRMATKMLNPLQDERGKQLENVLQA
jgi:hypothetical protein